MSRQRAIWLTLIVFVGLISGAGAPCWAHSGLAITRKSTNRAAFFMENPFSSVPVELSERKRHEGYQKWK